MFSEDFEIYSYRTFQGFNFDFMVVTTIRVPYCHAPRGVVYLILPRSWRVEGTRKRGEGIL